MGNPVCKGYLGYENKLMMLWAYFMMFHDVLGVSNEGAGVKDSLLRVLLLVLN